MKELSLPWQRVWITGAGKGIGRALAKRLCQNGVTVYVSARTASDLNELKAECCGYSGDIVLCQLDVTDADQLSELFKQWQVEKGVPDLAILNAGTHDPFKADEFDAGRCQRLMNVNFQGAVNCLEPLLSQYLANANGHIAVMASVAGYRGLPTAAAYGATKAALINMTESLRLDLKGTGVKIQLINPGFVRTPLTDKNDFDMPALLEPEDAAERIIKGLLSESFEVSFPRRFVYWLKFMRCLPYRCYFGLLGRFVKV